MNHKASAGLVGLLGCAAAPPAPQVPPSPAPTVVTPKTRQPAVAMFGRLDEAGRFMRVTDIKHVDGRNFGWRIRLPCTGPVEFTETMRLPAPGDWQSIFETRKSEPDHLRQTTITADGKQTITHAYAPCLDGWIEHMWSLSKGDPVGDWTIEVAIPSYATQTFQIKFR
jgi:hypothetical protein